jgi:type IV pilus assembly protein PilA
MSGPTKFANEKRLRRPQLGFSLIELLIVIAIILIIAAIAIPNFLRARISAHESSAVGSLRSINTAEAAYNSTYGAGYGTLTQLGSPGLPCTASSTSACLLDSSLSSGTKSGYTFTAVPVGTANVNFVASGVTFVVGVTGQRTFCVDESGAVRFDSNGGAAPADDVACEALTVLQ